MRRLTSGVIGIEQGDAVLFSDYESDGEMWRGEGPREIRTDIRFSEPFLSTPAVQVALSMGDMSNRTNLRFDVKAEDVTVEGFALVFRTWSDSRIARARVAWTAIGELPDPDSWTL